MLQHGAQGVVVCAAAALTAAAGRGRKAAAAYDVDAWDWQASRQRVLRVVHDVMRVDLRALFKGLAAAERMVNLCMELVSARWLHTSRVMVCLCACGHAAEPPHPSGSTLRRPCRRSSPRPP
jgi:hypothetical protein